MLIINSILGNMYKDSQLAKKIEEKKQLGKFRHLELSRTEMEKSRLRKKTADGLDVGFVLEPGTKLNHGDVISKSDEIILIEQLPEKTLTVKFMENDKNLFLLVGHIIGNRHRPISIKNETISFPIHDDSEMELFERLFHQIIDKIDLSIDEQRFIPRVGMDAHEH
ncbi:MAG TPA: Urease accessory protein [Candidatus Nitrosopelagicus sp.]|jgi:urease accessory protein|nr:Urease accessory protein [Candidatus Nitrosopelagicus sp.]HIF53241.1 Urease accessory protein [Candidatus Nitrosopelagicus sp.]